jgi:hypothetical protein
MEASMGHVQRYRDARLSLRVWVMAISACTLLACADDDPLAGLLRDAGSGDAGRSPELSSKPDSGSFAPVDSGAPAMDAGTMTIQDAGMMSSMPTDAGMMSMQDAGHDAGAPPPDAGDASTPIDASTPVDSGPPPEDLDSLEFHPTFAPDYNTLVPQPWVEVATTMQTATATVQPNKLIFPLADNPEVLDWRAGRVVVSAPGTGSGANPLGYARRVVSVATVGNTIEVMTETLSLEDIVTGDLQQTLDFDHMVDVDMSKLDLDWAAQNLYVDVDTLSPEIEDLQPDSEALPEVDENGDPVPGQPLFGSIVSAFKSAVNTVSSAVGAAASAVKTAAVTVWKAVTPASFTGAASISSNIEANYQGELFHLNYTKAFGEGGRTPVELSISGTGTIDANVLFKPGAQLGVSVPVPGHNTHFATWLNVDSQFRSRIALGLDLEAEIASADNQSGPELDQRIANSAEFAQDVLSQAREKFLGNPDMKPAGGWKKTVLITKPATQVIFAGPVPVVFTQTFQLDVECGFVAKAALKAEMVFERVSNIKFDFRYEEGRVTGSTPTFVNLKNRSVEITGGGSIQVSCGLIPRVNAFVYDTAGLFAGVRGSLVAQASYQSMCAADPLVSKMNSEVGIGLYGNIGVQIGGRLQAPGSSYAGKAGQKLGTDIGPFELWNTQFPLYEKVWNLNGGLGYCTPTCRNTMLDGNETDLNCGGGSCNACGASKMCQKNSDCAKGFCSAGMCSTSHCGDGVLDGDETGIDCGGAMCAKCRAGIACKRGVDCASGFCGIRPGNGSAYGYCVQDHCSDFIVSADETGLDCGGADCAKCAVGARCTVDTDCVSGFRDADFCVAGSCRDRIKSATESGIDCGGSSSCARCFAGQGCAVNADCAQAAPVCDPIAKVCARPMCEDSMQNLDETDVDCGGSCSGCAETKGCAQTSDCLQGLECHPTDSVCVTPTCTDTWKNGAETDVDCGGACTTKCALGKTCQNDTDCAVQAPFCSSMHKCTTLVCPPGQYGVGNNCVTVGIGFWSPADDLQRYACANAPSNADYTSATAGSAECPWSCRAGYLLNVNTNQCQANATVQSLRCNADEVAVGIRGQSGAWLDALGMRCAPFNGSQITGAIRSATSVGGSGGVTFTLDCGANEVLYQLSGINGWSTSSPNASWCSATNLSKVSMVCKNLSSGATRTLGTAGGTNGNCTQGLPGSNFSYQCPNGQFSTGVIVDSANTSQYVGAMYGVVCR